MQLKRVVITGMGAISPFGSGVDNLYNALSENRSAVEFCQNMTKLAGLRSYVAAYVKGVDYKQIARKYRRSMSPMSIFATLAAGQALAEAAIGEQECSSGRLGVSIGSTVGSTGVTEQFYADYFSDYSIERMKTTLFFQIMNHSCASNVAQTYRINGRLLAPAAACATGSQAIGYAYEMIAAGRQDMMLCGGADEIHPLTTATFDVMNAASSNYNDTPQQTPRPFACDRDGMVCGEGSGILLLESLQSARQRNAEIIAEVQGFATMCDTGSIANPDGGVMAACMENAMADAGVTAADVDYVNAHATATLQGDIAESHAINSVFGNTVAVSSLKGHLGHTMAASGALETIATVKMLQSGCLLPTLHLDHVDPQCAELDYIKNMRNQAVDVAVKNNFALGGVNTSLVLRRFAGD